MTGSPSAHPLVDTQVAAPTCELRSPGAVLLISCYELGHQPLGVASPAGFLVRAGFSPLTLDIAVEAFDEQRIAAARFIGISVPMHTALRLGVRVAARIRDLNPSCHICFYGLYASLNSDYLLDQEADSCLGGEYELPLVQLIESLETGNGNTVEGVTSRERRAEPYLERLEFVAPLRNSLPALENYAQLLHQSDSRHVGYAETSRGCLHLCTHCPIPPVYDGRFFVVPVDVVLEDIRRQVAAGATHITFGDPDFLNGPAHSLQVVRAMRAEFPSLTFDFTAKVEHLLTRGENLSEFADAGCLFIISAVESLSPNVLEVLAKQHTRQDVSEALARCRQAGIVLRPTWVAFTPWTTLDDYHEMLSFVDDNDLIDQVDPIQFSIRLLVPPGSYLAEHPALLPHRGSLDETALTWTWTHPDPQMDHLQRDVVQLLEQDTAGDVDPATSFCRIHELAHGRSPVGVVSGLPPDRQRAPRLTESWFC